MFRKTSSLYLFVILLFSLVNSHITVLAQQVPSCDIRALNQRWENRQFGEAVPPAPAELDLNGDGIVDSTDWLTCLYAFQNYMGQCDLHNLDDVFSQPCRGTPTDAPNTVGLQQCPDGVGPNGIIAGLYPSFLSAEARQWLWEIFGHSGSAPSDYAGEACVQTENVSVQPQPITSVAMLEATTGLRVRTGGSTSCQQIGTIRPGTSYAIEGKNNGSTWLQIAYDGQQGWVSAAYIRINDPSLMFVVPRKDEFANCLVPDFSEAPASENSGVLNYGSQSPVYIRFGATDLFVYGVTILDAGLQRKALLSPLDIACLPYASLLVPNSDLQQLIDNGNIICTDGQAFGTSLVILSGGVVSGASIVGLVPVLLDPNRYIDEPFLNRLHDLLDQRVISCTFARLAFGVEIFPECP